MPSNFKIKKIGGGHRLLETLQVLLWTLRISMFLQLKSLFFYRVIYLCFTFYVFYENVKKNNFFRYYFRKKILRFLFFIYVYVQFHILRFFLHFFILHFFTLFYVYIFLRFYFFFTFLFTKRNVNIKSIYVFYVYDFFTKT